MGTTPCLYTGSVQRRLQTAAPDRVFFEKDILSCGTWEGGDCPRWNVTTDVLDGIVNSFRLQKSRGIRIPLVYEHANQARDRVGEIDELWRDNCRLMARCWAAKEDDVRHLQQVSPEVSVGVEENWKDGEGNVYPIAIEHVAIVNNPVCHGQGPFRRLSLKQSSTEGKTMKEKFVKRTIRRLLADGGVVTETADVAVEDTTPQDGDTTIAVTEVVSMIGKYFGVDLPKDVDTAKELRLVLETMMSGSPDESESDATQEMVESMPVDSMSPAMLKLSLNTLRKRYSALNKEVATRRELDLSRAKDEYSEVLDEACTSGAITAAVREELMEVGKSVGYKLSLVNHLKNAQPGQSLQMGSKTRHLRNGKAPEMQGQKQPPSNERIQEVLKNW